MSQSVPIGFELQTKVLELETALKERHPRMPNLLQEIYVALRAQPENVTLLSPEEVAIIVSGLSAQTQTEFAASVVSSKTSVSKSINARIKAGGADAF